MVKEKTKNKEKHKPDVQSIDDLLGDVKSMSEAFRKGDYSTVITTLYKNQPQKAYELIEKMVLTYLAVENAEQYQVGMEAKEDSYGLRPVTKGKGNADENMEFVRNGYASPVAKQYATMFSEYLLNEAGFDNIPTYQAPAQEYQT